MNADSRSAGQHLTGKYCGRSVAILLAAHVILLLPLSSQAADVASAARSGDIDEVRSLLRQGSAVNEPERDGSTAVLWAAWHSDLELLETLVVAGADVNTANNLGVSPLLHVARVGDAAFVRALVEAGADPAAATLNGETVLMAAARAGSVDAVNYLLELGSDPNAVEDYQGQTALMWAAAEGHAGVVSQLLAAGADPDVQARISELTERSMRTDFPTGGFTAAMWAAREGHEDVLRVLVDNNANIDLLNGDGASALSIAIVNDRFDLAAALVELGANPDDGSLFRAVEMRDAPTDWRAKDGSRLRVNYLNELSALDLMRVLLEAGADPNKPFSGQNHSASMCCDTTASGTPFSRTASAADVEGLKLMVEFGADVEWMPEPSAGGGRGGGGSPFGGGGGSRTPLQSAMNGGGGIGMAGGPGDIREGSEVPFREVANRNPADAMAVLLAAGADPNREMSNGSTLLHDAAQDRDLDIVEVLAQHGAQLDALNRDGLTALDVAEGRRAEGGGGGGRRGGGPPFGGGFFGGAQADDNRPTQEQVAARLRELMGEAGVPIVEHGVASGGDTD